MSVGFGGSAHRSGAAIGVVQMAVSDYCENDKQLQHLPRITVEIEEFAGLLSALGFVSVAAAGNEGQDARDVFPCRADGIICVGSHDATAHQDADASAASGDPDPRESQYYELSWFSNYGPKVDLFAAGSQVCPIKFEPGGQPVKSKVADDHGTRAARY